MTSLVVLFHIKESRISISKNKNLTKILSKFYHVDFKYMLLPYITIHLKFKEFYIIAIAVACNTFVVIIVFRKFKIFNLKSCSRNKSFNYVIAINHFIFFIIFVPCERSVALILHSIFGFPPCDARIWFRCNIVRK